MNVVLFGATGMIGSGVLIECLEDPAVTRVLSLTRRTSARDDDKLEEIVHEDFTDFSSLAEAFSGVDACFFCLGVSAAGMSEARYREITFDMTAAAAAAIHGASPEARFVYISGAGADSSGTGRIMWARVKGQIENHLIETGRPVYILRPALIQPLKGVTSSTAWYRVFYKVTAPLFPLLRRFPKHVTTTPQIGRAMIRLARDGFPTPVLENGQINQLAPYEGGA